MKLVLALKKNSLNVSELANETKMEIANTSHHLGLLLNAGILRNDRRGRSVYYKLDDTNCSVEEESIQIEFDGGHVVLYTDK